MGAWSSFWGGVKAGAGAVVNTVEGVVDTTTDVVTKGVCVITGTSRRNPISLNRFDVEQGCQPDSGGTRTTPTKQPPPDADFDIPGIPNGRRAVLASSVAAVGRILRENGYDGRYEVLSRYYYEGVSSGSLNIFIFRSFTVEKDQQYRNYVGKVSTSINAAYFLDLAAGKFIPENSAFAYDTTDFTTPRGGTPPAENPQTGSLSSELSQAFIYDNGIDLNRGFIPEIGGVLQPSTATRRYYWLPSDPRSASRKDRGSSISDFQANREAKIRVSNASTKRFLHGPISKFLGADVKEPGAGFYWGGAYGPSRSRAYLVIDPGSGEETPIPNPFLIDSLGRSSEINSIGFFAKGSQLYFWGGRGTIYSLDPKSGMATFEASLLLYPGAMDGGRPSSTNAVYGDWIGDFLYIPLQFNGLTTPSLYRVNISDFERSQNAAQGIAATFVGTMEISGESGSTLHIYGFASLGSQLYAVGAVTVEEDDSGTRRRTNNPPSGFYRVNSSNGSLSRVGSSFRGSFPGAAYSLASFGGNLYTIEERTPSVLHSINPSTGAPTKIADLNNIGPGRRGMAYYSPPATGDSPPIELAYQNHYGYHWNYYLFRRLPPLGEPQPDPADLDEDAFTDPSEGLPPPAPEKPDLSGYSDQLSDLEDQIQDSLEDVDEVAADLEEVQADVRRQLAKARVQSFSPEYVTFDSIDLVKTRMFLQEDGTAVVDRGIFIIPSTDFVPKFPGDTSSTPQPGLLSLHPRNFTKCMIPREAFNGTIYQGFPNIPFQVNVGTSFCQWTTAGISKNAPTPYNPTTIRSLTTSYSDGIQALKPPHPLDHYYMSRIQSGNLEFKHFTYHALTRFFEVREVPEAFYFDHWATLLAKGSYENVIGPMGFFTIPKPGLRCKDMYLTLGIFKDYQNINELYPLNLERYTVDKTLLPNPQYDGSASQMLRLFPALSEEDQSNITDKFPTLEYFSNGTSACAYYVRASYPQPDLGNFDIHTDLNLNAVQSSRIDGVFESYYHHDMTDADDLHLRPTTFIFSCLLSSTILADFSQDGSDVPGPINNHKMQLISDTDATYRQLLLRVLPSLGYVVRVNNLKASAELVDIASKRNPTFIFGENMLELEGISYDSAQQFSSFIYENPDMMRGSHTLEEFRDEDNPLTGRFAVFNSNPFVQGRTLTIQTGTWTSEYSNVSTVLSLRQDRYRFRVSNFHLIGEIPNPDTPGEKLYTFVGPLVGDRVRLKSSLIPNSDQQVDLIIMSKSQDENVTIFEGIHIVEV